MENFDFLVAASFNFELSAWRIKACTNVTRLSTVENGAWPETRAVAQMSIESFFIYAKLYLRS
jgi:hypothetical protein